VATVAPTSYADCTGSDAADFVVGLNNDETFAKTLSLLDQPLFVNSSGKEHDWRADLVAALAKRQDSKGSWVNSTAGFMEGDANLVTAYGLLALAHARRPA
jgi:squalene-hopene/tetraprenyl-beta-curcumene cyclase